MIKAKSTVTINKPVVDVYKFVVTDYFVNHPEFDPKVVSSALDTNGPVAKGAKGTEVRKQGGKTQTFWRRASVRLLQQVVKSATSSGPKSDNCDSTT